MNTHTDEQLKKALAKLLPDKVKTSSYTFYWCGTNGGFLMDVKDTELLHLCWLVEQELNTNELMEFNEKLRATVYLYQPCWYDKWRNQSEAVTSSSWQQRVIALCKVMGVEI